MYYNYLNKTIVFMCVIALYFFSYIPFLIISSFIGVEKPLIFILLITVIFTLLLISFAEKIFRGAFKFDRRHVIALSLYVIFALYASASFTFAGGNLEDTYTIRTLTMVNTTFIIFSILCIQNKKYVITIATILSSVYFVLLIVSLAQGNMSLQSSQFQSIFTDIEGTFYQNINLYLGLFVICNLGFLSSDKKYISIIPMITIPLAMLGMFLTGGRGALAALLSILFIYLFKERKMWSFKIQDMIKKLMIFLILLCFIFFYLADLTELLTGSITWKRFMALNEENDTSQRIFLFSKAWELFSSSASTIAFGAGINSFKSYTNFSYPHNIFLELLAECGIVGTIIFTVPVVYVLSIRKKILGSIYGSSIQEKMAFLIFCYYLALHLFSGGLRYSWVFIFYLFFLLPDERNIQSNFLPVVQQEG